MSYPTHPASNTRRFRRTEDRAKGDAHWTSRTRQDAGPAPSGWRRAMAARYEVYRLNRRFRRHQREFHDVMDQCRHDPAAQREIALIWAVRED